jgi:hypothetical protein
VLGRTFGRLTVEAAAGRNKTGESVWACICSCGESCTVRRYRLTSGETQSCGCLQRERTRAARTTHGHTKGGLATPEYISWSGLRRRCLDLNDPDYGGRGITVCERWLTSFENFLADMGPRPAREYSIERKNNDGSYCKDNCIWATREQQQANTRQNRLVMVDGKPVPAKIAARKYGIPYTTVLHRLDRGFSDAEAMRR